MFLETEKSEKKSSDDLNMSLEELNFDDIVVPSFINSNATPKSKNKNSLSQMSTAKGTPNFEEKGAECDFIFKGIDF